MRRGIVFATSLLEPLVELARDAEAAGVDRVWTTEYPGRDAVARALALALTTERLEIGTGVAYAFTRPPLAMAALASDVHRLSGERFSLGISAGTRGVRRWYGAEFDPPAPKMAEYVTAVRERWRDTDTYPAHPPVYLPAFHPVMTRYASTVSDGLLLHPLAAIRTHLRDRVLPAIARGSQDREKPLDIAAWQMTAIDDDEDRARRRAAAQIAFYLSTPSYAVAVEGTPWNDVPERVRTAAAESGEYDWMMLGALIPEDLVDELAVAGRPADVSRRLDEVADRLGPLGVTELVVQTVGAGQDDQTVAEDCRQIVRSLRATAEGESR